MSDAEHAYLQSMNLDLQQANERNLELIEELRHDLARKNAELAELRNIIAAAALYVSIVEGDITHLDEADALADLSNKTLAFLARKKG